MRHFFDARLLHSRVSSKDVGKAEQILGYFLGPCLVYMMYTGIAGTYLTQFYTDVLGLAGGFLTLMPLVSKIISSIASFVIGRMIDRTRTSQGKARPWILASGILLAVCGILLYAVPKASCKIQIAWVVVSYNLFFGLAFSIYSLSHTLMVPLSTRNTKQWDALAMLTSTGTSMIPGILATILMPLLISRIGVGENAQGSWLTIMGVLSILAIPATLMEYYFTIERVTAESDHGTFPDSAACRHQRLWLHHPSIHKSGPHAADAVRSFFIWCFAGLPMIGYGVCAAIMVLYNLEPQTHPAKEETSPQTNSRS